VSSEPGRFSLDNLTHALVGAAISKGGAERATPLATATLVISANAPDIDVLSYLRGEYFALSFRRGLTHGLLALILLPFVVTPGILAWDRWVRRWQNPGAEPVRPLMLLGLSTVGLVTHPVLDWMNTYGMRWSLPFRYEWSDGDALFIIDPWIWLVLGGSLFIS
jgi:inner membrane protein